MKNKFKYLSGLIIAVMAFSCSPMDEYKDFITNGGEIQYTGRVDSVLVYSGKERVMVTGLFVSDPKITECRIFWNSRLDSVSVPVVRTEKVDTLKQILNLPENLYNFEIYTYDNQGNRSVPVFAMGTSYGSGYEKSLPNRIISGSPIYIEAQGLKVNWYSIDQTLGPVETKIKYTDLADASVVAKIEAKDTEIMIADYKPGTTFTYQTSFLPDTLCLDTFYTVTSAPVMPISKIDKSLWSIAGFSSEEHDGKASSLIDDDFSTFWHSAWRDTHPGFPHYVSIDMGIEHLAAGVELTPRQNVGGSSLKDFSVLVSMDGNNWTKVQSFRMENVENISQTFIFEEKVAARYIQILMESGHSSDPHTHCSEISVFE